MRWATLARVAAGQLKALIVSAPEELRAELRGRSAAGKIHYCAGLRTRSARSLEHQTTVRAVRATAHFADQTAGQLVEGSAVRSSAAG
jgi:transposase